MERGREATLGGLAMAEADGGPEPTVGAAGGAGGGMAPGGGGRDVGGNAAEGEAVAQLLSAASGGELTAPEREELARLEARLAYVRLAGDAVRAAELAAQLRRLRAGHRMRSLQAELREVEASLLAAHADELGAHAQAARARNAMARILRARLVLEGEAGLVDVTVGAGIAARVTELQERCMALTKEVETKSAALASQRASVLELRRQIGAIEGLLAGQAEHSAAAAERERALKAAAAETRMRIARELEEVDARLEYTERQRDEFQRMVMELENGAPGDAQVDPRDVRDQGSVLQAGPRNAELERWNTMVTVVSGERDILQRALLAADAATMAADARERAAAAPGADAAAQIGALRSLIAGHAARLDPLTREVAAAVAELAETESMLGRALAAAEGVRVAHAAQQEKRAELTAALDGARNALAGFMDAAAKAAQARFELGKRASVIGGAQLQLARALWADREPERLETAEDSIRGYQAEIAARARAQALTRQRGVEAQRLAFVLEASRQRLAGAAEATWASARAKVYADFIAAGGKPEDWQGTAPTADGAMGSAVNDGASGRQAGSSGMVGGESIRGDSRPVLGSVLLEKYAGSNDRRVGIDPSPAAGATELVRGQEAVDASQLNHKISGETSASSAYNSGGVAGNADPMAARMATAAEVYKGFAQLNAEATGIDGMARLPWMAEPQAAWSFAAQPPEVQAHLSRVMAEARRIALEYNDVWRGIRGGFPREDTTSASAAAGGGDNYGMGVGLEGEALAAGAAGGVAAHLVLPALQAGAGVVTRAMARRMAQQAAGRDAGVQFAAFGAWAAYSALAPYASLTMEKLQEALTLAVDAATGGKRFGTIAGGSRAAQTSWGTNGGDGVPTDGQVAGTGYGFLGMPSPDAKVARAAALAAQASTAERDRAALTAQMASVVVGLSPEQSDALVEHVFRTHFAGTDAEYAEARAFTKLAADAHTRFIADLPPALRAIEMRRDAGLRADRRAAGGGAPPLAHKRVRTNAQPLGGDADQTGHDVGQPSIAAGMVRDLPFTPRRPGRRGPDDTRRSGAGLGAASRGWAARRRCRQRTGRSGASLGIEAAVASEASGRANAP